MEKCVRHENGAEYVHRRVEDNQFHRRCRTRGERNEQWQAERAHFFVDGPGVDKGTQGATRRGKPLRRFAGRDNTRLGGTELSSEPIPLSTHS